VAIIKIKKGTYRQDLEEWTEIAEQRWQIPSLQKRCPKLDVNKLKYIRKQLLKQHFYFFSSLQYIKDDYE
jgi:hypothetical protein